MCAERTCVSADMRNQSMGLIRTDYRGRTSLVRISRARPWAKSISCSPSSNGANFTRADLNDANFAGADLTAADLTGANISGTDFTSAVLAGVRRRSRSWRAKRKARCRDKRRYGRRSPMFWDCTVPARCECSHDELALRSMWLRTWLSPSCWITPYPMSSPCPRARCRHQEIGRCGAEDFDPSHTKEPIGFRKAIPLPTP